MDFGLEYQKAERWVIQIIEDVPNTLQSPWGGMQGGGDMAALEHLKGKSIQLLSSN